MPRRVSSFFLFSTILKFLLPRAHLMLTTIGRFYCGIVWNNGSRGKGNIFHNIEQLFPSTSELKVQQRNNQKNNNRLSTGTSKPIGRLPYLHGMAVTSRFERSWNPSINEARAQVRRCQSQWR